MRLFPNRSIGETESRLYLPPTKERFLMAMLGLNYNTYKEFMVDIETKMAECEIVIKQSIFKDLFIPEWDTSNLSSSLSFGNQIPNPNPSARQFHPAVIIRLQTVQSIPAFKTANRIKAYSGLFIELAKQCYIVLPIPEK